MCAPAAETTATPATKNSSVNTYKANKSTRITTKKQTAIQLLRRSQGASLNEMEERLSWQPHSVRGFISGTLRKLDGFELVSQSGEHRYRLIKQAA